jgi:TRAP transporter 4TM/12TM fusion protein
LEQNSNSLVGQTKKWYQEFNLIFIIAIAMSIFQLYTANFGLMTAMLQRGIHLYFALTLIFLIKPYKRKGIFFVVLNWVCIAATVVVAVYMVKFATPQLLTARAITGLTRADMYIGGLLLILILEGTRRICGLPMVIIAALFILYARFGQMLPGMLAHRGYSLLLIINQSIFTHEGVFGIPLAVSSTFVILFVIFGAFLELSGAGQFFIDIAFAMTGRTRSGPAMTAVVASSFMGSINGVAAANVVTTGAFTIPLMSKVGYSNVMAGAVEAAASTGGQILPPVMGASAFIMAEVLGIGYAQVALAATVPALLYFISVGYMVHLEAIKRGIKATEIKNIPNFKKTLVNGIQFLIPLIVLIHYLLIVRYTPTKAAIYAILATVLVSMFRKNTRMGAMTILRALELGVKNSLIVASACATAGIVIGIVTITGLGLRFSNMIISLSGNSLFLALIFTAITCIILGMGLPTSAAYIITATLGGPVLIRMGVTPIAAHLFILYFAVVSVITPPVAIAAYAAAGIANDDPLKIAVQATRLGIAAYVIPFMFVYGPALVLVGTVPKIILAIITALIGSFLLACGVQGYMVTCVKSILIRALIIFAALSLISTNIYYNLAGVAVVVVVLLFQFRQKKRETVAQAAAI